MNPYIFLPTFRSRRMGAFRSMEKQESSVIGRLIHGLFQSSVQYYVLELEMRNVPLVSVSFRSMQLTFRP